MSGIDASAERRRPPGPESDWTEGHRLDLLGSRAGHASLGDVGVSLQLLLQPNRQRAGFLCAVLEVGRPPIVISELEIPLPASGLEVRSTGLWAEFVCEQPLDHWSYGLEAFALAIEEPEDLLGRAFGDRVPIGWELEFEADGPARSVDVGAGYRQTGIGHGLLLSSAGEQEIEGAALRSHWWGVQAPEASAAGADDVHWPNGRVVLPGFNEQWWVSLGPSGVKVAARPIDGVPIRAERR